MAEKVNVNESTPRVCKVQMHRNNHPSTSPNEYFQRQITIPLLDHLSAEIDSRFDFENCIFLKGFYIVPGLFLDCLSEVDWKKEFLSFVEAYRDDIPSYSSTVAEIELWEKFWKGNIEAKVPKTIGESLKLVDKVAFPNVYTCLKILSVVPVTSCECERSISALRRMKTWLRSTMGQERLNGIALMHINSDIKINVEEGINEFARSNKTRMRLLDVFEDKIDTEDREAAIGEEF